MSFFDTPQYVWKNSLLNDNTQIHGNNELANKIVSIVKEQCLNKLDLYEALDYLHTYCVNIYGEDFYKKNAEAISFLVENEYCNLERQQRPYFDKGQYDEDMERCTLY